MHRRTLKSLVPEGPNGCQWQKGQHHSHGAGTVVLGGGMTADHIGKDQAQRRIGEKDDTQGE